MIQTKELRIGNYVSNMHGEILKVSIVTENAIHSKEKYNIIGCPSSCINPIPLTEEWLIKFSYSNYPHGDALFLPGHLIWKCNDLLIDDKNGIVLKYVHQLQNLYFALTGIELQQKNN